MNNPGRHIIVKDIGFSLLAEGTTLRVKADGYSMYPAIKPGSVVLIEPLAEGITPSPGEIIAWKRETGFVVHRLVKIIRDNVTTRFITRGDSCAYDDQPVTFERIAGKVIRIETQSGSILTSGDNLIHKPLYLYNRLIVWVLVRIRKILNPNRPPRPPNPPEGGLKTGNPQTP